MMFETTTAVLCAAAFFAGFVDAIVGGGGLIQVPAMLIMLPGAPIASVFGTNKLASLAGTSVALWQITRKVTVPWASILPGALCAAIFAFLGARAVSLINPQILKPVILALLIGVAIYTFIRKDLGALHAPSRTPSTEKLISMGIGAVLGFYEGFFGPGTGSFLIFAFIGLLGFQFMVASASAKVINITTNFSALTYFAYTGNVIYELAIPMAVCNVAGSLLGARLALEKGAAFIRMAFLVVMGALIIRYAYDVFYK